MNDYTWPSVYFSYLFFALSLAVAVFFFVRSLKDGYWGKGGEEVKYRVFEEEEAGQEACPTSGAGLLACGYFRSDPSMAAAVGLAWGFRFASAPRRMSWASPGA